MAPAVTFIANTSVTVYDATTTQDEYGDDIGEGAVVATGIPASLTEQSARVSQEYQGENIQVGIVLGIVGSTVSVESDYKLRDERTDELYFVDRVTQYRGLLGDTDKRLLLRKVG